MVTKAAQFDDSFDPGQPRATMPETARNKECRETIIASMCAMPLPKEAAS